ncbi:MAG: DUF655 domain-containing protein [Hormoscilla sp. GUM202]|nr:DUF655 domain-containing protein [Hormoscilla sp. GUM202]
MSKFLPLHLVSALLLGLTMGCQKVPPPQPRPEPLPQDTWIEVYFNQSQSEEYTEPYREVRRSGDDLEQEIVDTINKAQSSVDVAVQELRLPKIARALVDRHQAGVQVRVILENTYSRPLSEMMAAEVTASDGGDRNQEYWQWVDRDRDGKLSETEINQGEALAILRNAKVPTIDDTADGSAGSGLMHHKFVIVDGRTSIVGSANFTPSGIHGDFAEAKSRGNANHLLKIESYELAQLFTQEFNVMWGDGRTGNPDSRFGLAKTWRPVKQVQLGDSLVSVQFSPISPSQPWSKSGNGLIAKTLGTASKSVDLALFVFSEQKLVNVLESNHRQGVEIRALIDRGFAWRNYSEALDMLGVAIASNCKYEADNRPWASPIATVGVPILPPGDKLHHKFAVIDGETVITGSQNWSPAANHNNDETLLVIENPTVAAHFVREFNRLYTDAQLGVPARLQRQLLAQEQECSQITTPSNYNLTGQKVNLNTATQAELETLPGIGPELARRIIQARQQKPFTSLEDLDNVSGIGPKMLERLESRVTW